MPAELRSSKKGLINIKNNDQKCFLWCHVRHINPVKIHPERITQNDKLHLIKRITLNCDKVGFPVREKILSRLKQKAIFASKCTVMKASLYISDQEFENLMDLLLVIEENKPYYVYIKDFN